MLEGLVPLTQHRKCLAGRLLESLEKPDAIILQEALDDTDKWSSNGLEAALASRGIKLGNETIRKHRDRLCLCSRI